MTFTMIGRCGKTGRTGIALATVSLGVGGLCIFVTKKDDIVSSQAYAQPKVGVEVTRLLDSGCPPAQLENAIKAADPYYTYRQVGVLSRSGVSFVYTGPDARPWAGHITGPDYIAMGNFLAGSEVLKAMVEGFNKDTNMDLEERLMLALEASRDAGGQRAATGEHCAERSSALLVIGEGSVREIDLRVDIHSHAVEELRWSLQIFKKYNSFNRLRAEDPPHTPALVEWEKENLSENPPPSPIL
jgi:uncharacterized Ntn-hydrolase superfamily protein